MWFEQQACEEGVGLIALRDIPPYIVVLMEESLASVRGSEICYEHETSRKHQMFELMHDRTRTF